MWDTGIYPYSLLFGARRNQFGDGESVRRSMLPHEVGVVGYKPTILHPAGQSEAQVHPDVVVKGPVICRRVRTERAIPVCHITLNDLASVNQATAPLHFSCGGWADYIVQANIPVTTVV